MAKVRELFTVWGFDIDMKPLERLDQGIATTKESIKAIALTALASGASVFGLVKTTADAGNEALKTAQKIGLTVEAFQELRFASRLGTEEFQGVMTIFNRRIYEGGQGSKEALKPFTQLGLRIRDNNGHLRNAGDLLTTVSDRFKSMPDGPKKTALAVELFGRAGANIIPMLNKGSEGIAHLREEAHKLGLVFSDDEAKAAGKFKMELLLLHETITGIWYSVGKQLIPTFTELVHTIQETIMANRDLIQVNVKQFVDIVIDVFTGMVTIMKETVRIVRDLAQVFGGFVNIGYAVSTMLKVLLAIKLAYGFGQAALAVYQLAAGFSFAGNAALLAQAKLLLIPLAITAIIAAIALLVEDFLVFKSGGNSVFGLVFDALGELFDTLGKKFQGMGTFGKVLVTAILTPLRTIINGFMTLKGLLDVIFGDKKFTDFLRETGYRLLNNFGFGTGGTLEGALGVNTFFQGGQDLVNMGPARGAAPLPSSITGTATSISQKGELNVNVQGLPPDIAEKVAKASMSEAFENVLRQTGRDAESHVER
jgi:hypothetical protein